MSKRLAGVIAFFSLTISVSMAIALSSPRADDRDGSGLTVHEWGTFTTVAGVNGQAIDWLPLGGPTDLPCFVNHFDLDARLLPKVVASPGSTPLSYAAARSQLVGSVRMETPVVYFYSQTERVVDVKVDFPNGIVSEWYPPAAVTPSIVRRNTLTSTSNTQASITWPKVKVLPNAANSFATGAEKSHYYAARATDAAPIAVNGINEKFLFYRGVGKFPAPINAIAQDDGQIAVRYLNGKSNVILFENRAGKMGYRLIKSTANQALVSPPELTADFGALRNELEAILVAEGLYFKEAQAMVDTWRDSWFEEGTRLFYITPASMVERILPLQIRPTPRQVVRVFVGRVELITRRTLKDVRDAIGANDQSALASYGRFLGPISERLQGQSFDEKENVSQILDSTFKNYVADLQRCTS